MTGVMWWGECFREETCWAVVMGTLCGRVETRGVNSNIASLQTKSNAIIASH